MNNIDKAYDFYKKHIYDIEKFRLLREHNFKVAGSVSSVLWELFAAIITGNKGNGNNIGADLRGWEVKSAVNGGSFEYQYHLNTGAQKLNEDKLVNHIFCSYSSTYSEVQVYGMPGTELGKEYFDPWLPEYTANYNTNTSAPAQTRRQRFRKSIPHGHITRNGLLILKISCAAIIERHDEILIELSK